ncbi:hypothetical protein EDB87DRAFT_1574671 [Lactarius vividus]|nr:hypothetical protein EDB87DRAFT_1574671 [Lactarius vividus]
MWGLNQIERTKFLFLSTNSTPIQDSRPVTPLHWFMDNNSTHKDIMEDSEEFLKVQMEMFCEDDHTTIQGDVDLIMALAAALAMSIGSSAGEGNDITALLKPSQLSLYVTSIAQAMHGYNVLSKLAILFSCSDRGTGSSRMMTMVHTATWLPCGLAEELKQIFVWVQKWYDGIRGYQQGMGVKPCFVKTTFFKGHSPPIHCLSPKFNDLFPISGAMDEVKIWKHEVQAVEQVESWELKVKLPPPSVLDLCQVVEVTSVNWKSQDVGTSASLAVVCWDVAGMTVLWQFPIDKWCNGSATLSLSPDRRLTATVDRTNNFEIQDLKSGAVQSLEVCYNHARGWPNTIVKGTFSACFAVTGTGGDNKAYVWDAKRGDQLLCLKHGSKCTRDDPADATQTAFLEEDDRFLIVTATENSGKSYIFLWASVPRVMMTSTSSPIGGNHIELKFLQNFWMHLSFMIVVVAVLLKW